MNDNIKLIIFDLDDTLLNSNKIITPKTKEIIIECQKRKIRIGYITARSPRKISTFIGDLSFNCISNYNGAIICAENKLIASHTIKYEEGVKLIQAVKKELPNIQISGYFEPLVYVNNEIRNSATQEVVQYTLFNVPKYDFQRVRLVIKGYEYIDFMKYVTADMNYVPTVDGAAIITNCNANKENALKGIMKYYGLDSTEVISFGDDINDIGMFKASGIGVAMGNAVQQLKAVADYVTLSNDEDGIAQYLEKYILS